MKATREIVAVVVALVVILAVLIGVYFARDVGSTAPVQRTEEQNQGSAAPQEQLPSPGTVKQEGGAATMEQQP